MTWKLENSQGNESGKIKYELVRYTTGRGLDVGCGPWKAYKHFIGVDNYTDTALFNIHMEPDVKCNADDLKIFADQSLDFVYSSHTLEHLEDTKKVLTEWWRVIKPGGYLLLYLPHKDFYPNIGTEGSNPDHKHDFLPQDIVEVMKEVGEWDLVRNEDRNEGEEYSFFQVYRKLQSPGKLYSYRNFKAKKRAAVVRYGGIGDMIQTSSVFAGLKKQGYHVTVYTTPQGHDICAEDPNVDDWYIQGKDQIPNEELPLFWANEEKKYDKFVQLSECVEGTWLALPGRPSHGWPTEVRDKYLSKNYLEFMHDLAGIPYQFAQKFYPTTEEKREAREEAEKLGNRIVVWSLSGSALHKAYPWTDIVIARILLGYPDVSIVLMGDDACRILEGGWVEEGRVLKTSGQWKVRKSLAFLRHADVIIGPETGILNAAGFMNAAKIIFLSHSNEENLTKHWVNTTALKPENVSCFPCHRLHYSWEHCNQDAETFAAMCQAKITPDQVWDAITKYLGAPKQWQQAAA